MSDEYPQVVPQPEPGDTVQVVMDERMARRFEERCLGKDNTVGDTYLTPPLIFSEEDLPTYIIGVRLEGDGE